MFLISLQKLELARVKERMLKTKKTVAVHKFFSCWTRTAPVIRCWMVAPVQFPWKKISSSGFYRLKKYIWFTSFTPPRPFLLFISDNLVLRLAVPRPPYSDILWAIAISSNALDPRLFYDRRDYQSLWTLGFCEHNVGRRIQPAGCWRMERKKRERKKS